jgi:hypothetical protein
VIHRKIGAEALGKQRNQSLPLCPELVEGPARSAGVPSKPDFGLMGWNEAERSENNRVWRFLSKPDFLDKALVVSLSN